VIAVDRGAAVAEPSLDPPLDGDTDAVGDDEMVDEEVALIAGSGTAPGGVAQYR